MKYVSLFFSVIMTTGLFAQTFDWNTKSPAAHPQEVSPATYNYDAAYNERQNGLAGIYNPNANGMRTAYGETYRADQLTASHPVLPLGTLVRVTNYDNGREAIIRINDRGRECPECLITLSQAAAQQLGVGYRSRVSVERSGFSNWNPSATPVTAAPVTAYQSNVARPGVVAPSPAVSTYQGAKSAYPPVQQSLYDRAYATQGAPAYQRTTVMDREVAPVGTAAAPDYYARYPAVANPAAAQPGYGVTPAPALNRPQTYQPPVYQAPVAYQPVTINPPAPTVPAYQASRSVGAPVTTAAAAPPTGGTYAVQLAAYNNEAYAQRRVEELRAQGMENVYYRSVNKPDGQVINRVYSGNFATMAEAQSVAKRIQGQFSIAGIVARM